MTKPYEVAVVVGRVSPYHLGHGTLMERGFELADRVVLVLGSAFHARDTLNPFTWEERKAMVSLTLTSEQLERTTFLPVPDFYDDNKWNKAVESGVAALGCSSTRVVVVGHDKDASSYYLRGFPSWKVDLVGRKHDIDATALRNVYFADSAPSVKASLLAPYVHPAVLDYLTNWQHLPFYASRAEEHQAILEYRKKYTAKSYDTSDAVVVCRDHLLLIQRGKVIGRGLWALPGGFVEPNERFLNAALRELGEETKIGLLNDTLLRSLKDWNYFDHPRRSARARLVTHAFFFDLGDMNPPEVHGSDDAAAARWVPKSEVRKMREVLFEDHQTIIGSFLPDWV